MRVVFLAWMVSFVAWGATSQDRVQEQYDSIVIKSPNKYKSFTAVQREELFKRVNHHPVAGLDQLERYDHQPTGIGDGEIGFCYGRAMAVHLLARKMGLANNRIRKIFIAGDLNNGRGIRWRFHMATMVDGEDGNLYVIDPIMPSLGHSGVLFPNTWMRAVKEAFDSSEEKNKSHFYVTDTQSILVDMRVVPAQAEFENQDRLIEPSFDPKKREGFTEIQFIDHEADQSRYPVYTVSPEAQAKYFIMREEKPVGGKKLNDFDFFSLAIVILYRFPHEAQMTYITRAYHYNDYFVDLVNTVGSAALTEELEPNVSLVRFHRVFSMTTGLHLHGFADPKLEID